MFQLHLHEKFRLGLIMHLHGEAALASDPAAQSCASQACDKKLATNSFMTIFTDNASAQN